MIIAVLISFIKPNNPVHHLMAFLKKLKINHLLIDT